MFVSFNLLQKLTVDDIGGGGGRKKMRGEEKVKRIARILVTTLEKYPGDDDYLYISDTSVLNLRRKVKE